MRTSALEDSNFDSAEDDQYESLISSAKIMLVDDEPINTDVLQTYLEGEGYSNFVATSESKQALSIMRNEKPEVVLLDLMMPEVSGFDILNEMRRDRRLQHIPVVILTSSDDADTKLKALKLGAMDFLAKPVDASELALRLRNTLAAKAYQHQLVHFDQLTGLPKIDSFLESTVAVIKTLDAQKTNGAALHIYLENLKSVNYTMGREQGNRLIQAFARKLESCVRSADIIRNAFSTDISTNIARTGGDKFTVFLGHLENPQQAAVLARRIIIDTSEPIKLDGQVMFTSSKIGIAVYPDDANDPHTLLTNAETAMSHAREHGGGEGYAFYSGGMNEESTRIMAIENGLRSAIENDELRVTYQPKVDLMSGKIIGAEALIRWISPDLGFVADQNTQVLLQGSTIDLQREHGVRSCRKAKNHP